MWVYYQLYRTALDQYWLRPYWQTDAISDWPTAEHARHFAATFFILCYDSCVVDNGIFLYGWCKRLSVPAWAHWVCCRFAAVGPQSRRYRSLVADRSILCWHIAIFVIFNVAAVTIVVFQKFEILTFLPLKGPDLHQHAKSHQNQSDDCGDMAI